MCNPALIAAIPAITGTTAAGTAATAGLTAGGLTAGATIGAGASAAAAASTAAGIAAGTTATSIIGGTAAGAAGAAAGLSTAQKLTAATGLVSAAAPIALAPKTPKISAPPGGSILGDYDAARKAARNKMRAMGASGKSSTILTGQSGDGGVPSYGSKALLGQ